MNETEELRKAIDIGEALERLEQNPDFNLVIKTGFLEEGIKANTKVLAYLVNDDQRKRSMDELLSRSTLERYLDDIALSLAQARVELYQASEDK